MKDSLTAFCIRMRLRADISIAEIFGIGVSLIKKTLRAHRDEEFPVRSRGAGAVPSLNEEQLETLQAAVEICPHATLEALQRIIADECEVMVSQMSIRRALKRLNLPLAKRVGDLANFRSPGREERSL
jgi:transposase